MHYLNESMTKSIAGNDWSRRFPKPGVAGLPTFKGKVIPGVGTGDAALQSIDVVDGEEVGRRGMLCLLVPTMSPFSGYIVIFGSLNNHFRSSLFCSSRGGNEGKNPLLTGLQLINWDGLIKRTSLESEPQSGVELLGDDDGLSLCSKAFRSCRWTLTSVRTWAIRVAEWCDLRRNKTLNLGHVRDAACELNVMRAGLRWISLRFAPLEDVELLLDGFFTRRRLRHFLAGRSPCTVAFEGNWMVLFNRMVTRPPSWRSKVAFLSADDGELPLNEALWFGM